ncbi:MAG: DUF2336 domain-containing protein [Rhizobiales bacterium]|nr:DUF2336 domain-containing protein [Hyphomicrobiales bacterium]
MMKFSAYPPLDGLFDLACRDGVDIRPTLLRVLTDLYVQKPAHSADEETQYVELALGLIEVVDAPTRAAVLASLSAYPAAPRAILRKLAGTASDPGDADAGRARTDTQDLVELFFTAGAEERRLILSNLDVAERAVSGRSSPATSEVIRRLEASALQRNVGEFSRMLERALGISRELAERMTSDRSGEPIVVAAKALGMQAAVLQRILLFLNPAIGQSVERVYDLARLFDELVPAAAERMVTIWQTVGKRSRPVYAPGHWDDERRSARALSTPAPRREVQRRDGQHSRLKTGGQK